MAETQKRAKKSKKNRKHGRNSHRCMVYASSKRREHNKLRRLRKRVVRHPNDKVALKAIEACRAAISG